MFGCTPDNNRDFRRELARNLELAVERMQAPRRPRERTYDTVLLKKR